MPNPLWGKWKTDDDEMEKRQSMMMTPNGTKDLNWSPRQKKIRFLELSCLNDLVTCSNDIVPNLNKWVSKSNNFLLLLPSASGLPYNASITHPVPPINQRRGTSVINSINRAAEFPLTVGIEGCTCVYFYSLLIELTFVRTYHSAHTHTHTASCTSRRNVPTQRGTRCSV